MAIKLLVTALCNAALATLLYILEKRTALKKMPYMAKQTLYGVLFGLIAIYSSTPLGGVDMGGAIVNVRDAAPLCAGLLFGGPSGIIAGLVGGVFRFVAVFMGIAGEYTQLACSLSTMLAGFIAAALRRYMFDNKKPTLIYAIGIATICEILHMLMIFFTNMNDVATAFNFVKTCTVPMVLGNVIAVGTAFVAISLISGEKRRKSGAQKQISQTFQFWLFVCIVVAFVATSVFTAVLQSRMSQTQTGSVIDTSLEDIYQNINDESDENLLNKVTDIKREYLDGKDVDTLAREYNVIEVNIIDTNGIIVSSNNKQYIGYNMSSGAQSAEFLVLLEGEKHEFIQDYRPTSYDNKTYRKYGAITLPDGGFLQVGYDASQFGEDIHSFASKVARHRHIGNKGFVMVCDENLTVVTENSEYYGKKLEQIGFDADLSAMTSDNAFEVRLKDVSYLCQYHFVEGYYIIGLMPVDEALFMMSLSVYVNVFTQIVIFAALFVLIYFLIKKIIIDNIRKINTTLAQITDGNLNVTVEVRSNEEFASLSDDINSTVTTLKKYIVEAAARIDKELEFAQLIQYSSLPTVFPERCEFELFAKMATAKEVGGDFYDFYMLDDHKVAFLVADVSGKGIPAAMFMMKAKTTIKDLAQSGLEPDEVFTEANNRLCENNDAGMFVTAWLGILDLSSGILKFVNAGHNPPLIAESGGSFEYLKARSGLVLAGMEGIKYRKNELQLAPGDRIFLYTDGVTEATNGNTELYGEERLLDFVNGLGKVSPQELCKRIEENVSTFVGQAPQFDDITMLSLTFDCVVGENEISLLLREESRQAVDDFAQAIATRLELLPKIANKINIIFDEIYTNIFSYSNATTASVSYRIENSRLYLTFADDGVPYNPLMAQEPDITLSAQERSIGGLGIFIVRKMAENMEYVYEDNKNVLKITIRLE